MRPIVSSSLLLCACGGPIGVPVGAPPQDTASPVVAARHGSIVGTVTDDSGAAVEGALVVSEPHGHEASSDASGSFELPWLPAGEYQLVVSAPGLAVAEPGPYTVVVGEETIADLQLGALAPRSLVEVWVTGPDGEALEGALVSASSGEQASTDAAGLALLEGVCGEDLDLVVEHSDAALWPSGLEGVSVDASGGLQWHTQLAGRPSPDASYVGPMLCGYCHPDQAEAHAATAHARAFVEEPSDALLAGLELGWTASMEPGIPGAAVRMGLEAGQPTVTLVPVEGSERSYPVVAYIGDPTRSTVPVVQIGEQRYPLPILYRAASGARRDFPDTQEHLLAFEPERWFDALGDYAFGGDGPDPALSAEASCLPCHSAGYELTPRDDGGVDLSYASAAAAFEGVACEACHGPGGDHTGTTDPGVITRPDQLDAQRADEACGQCHGRSRGLSSGLPHPHAEAERFTPGAVLADYAEADGERWASGAAAQSRMQLDEHRDAQHGERGLRCIDCHQAHAGEPSAAMLRLEADDNALCEACHMAGFLDDEAVALEHMGHRLYQPEGNQEGARCTGCHMPLSGSDSFWSEQSGAGTNHSHGFLVTSPADTLAAFDAAGSDVLEPGAFPVHACADCHAWNTWYLDGFGLEFRAVHGDPTLRETHEAYLVAWEELYQ
jgi:predicted CXXCH cytochrome family protein